MDKLEIEYFPVSDIQMYENNPRHNEKAVDIVIKSIKRYGWRVPIILGKGNVIIAGHTRLKAAIKMGLTEVPVVWADDLTEADQKGLRIMDNKSSEYASWDFDLLKSELEELQKMNIDLDLTGFSEVELDKIMPNESEEDFEIPKEPKYKIQLGEIWQLENHRLMCGDCTIKENVDKLMDEQKADIILTDPPYDLDCSIGGGFYKKQNKKHLDEIEKSFGTDFNPESFLITYQNFTKNGLIVWLSKNLLQKYLNFAIENKFNWDLMFWHKINSIPNHFNHMLMDTEYCIRIFKTGAYFNNDLNYEDYHRYFLEKLQHIEGHPTPKPIEIIKKQLKLFTKENFIILDLYGGSGSTLIACEQTNRKCFMMEIDPYYCSVILERWEKFTNKQAIKL